MNGRFKYSNMTIGKTLVSLGAVCALHFAGCGYRYCAEPFAVHSHSGIVSTNPCHIPGDRAGLEASASPSRLVRFRLKVKNSTYPEPQVDPLITRIVVRNGRNFVPPGLSQIGWYDRITLPAMQASPATATRSACVSGAALQLPGDMTPNSEGGDHAQ